MRYLTTLAFFLLLPTPHAQACIGPDLWYRLFFETIPDPQPDADLIAIVLLSDTNIQEGSQATATASVIQVLKTNGARVKQGDRIKMKYQNTSCGPYPSNGSKGMIIAKTTTDNKGRVVLHPYTHRNYDGRIDPPAILPDGFDSRLKPLKIGEVVPQNFAVILIGVVGTESLDFLRLDHSVRNKDIFPAFLVPPKGIVAIAIPVGIRQLNVSQVTTGRQRAGARPDDTVSLNTPKLDIDRPGLYYVATLDTSNPERSQIKPVPEQLKQFHADYISTASSLEPINFKWPSQ